MTRHYTEDVHKRVRDWILQNPTARHSTIGAACQVHTEFARKIRRQLKAQGKVESLPPGPAPPDELLEDAEEKGRGTALRQMVKQLQRRNSWLEDRLVDVEAANAELAQSLVRMSKLCDTEPTF